MAKGKIKSLVAPWSDFVYTRNGVAFKLGSVRLERGGGTDDKPTNQYLGFIGNDEMTLEQWVKFTSKNQETADSALATGFFVNKLASLFNGAVCRNAWRGIVEPLGEVKAESLTEAQKSEVLSKFTIELDNYFGEIRTREVEKGSSYYRKQVVLVETKLTPLKKKAAGILANLSAEEQLLYRELITTKNENIKLAEQKEKEELDALTSFEPDIDLDEEVSGVVESPETK